VVFLISMFILRRAVFPRIGEALDRRAKAIEGEIDAAGQLREEADKVLAEYRERLKEARSQSEEIVARARHAAEEHEQEAREHGRAMVAEATKRAQREIEVATKRALDDLRSEVADLTIMATEKVTRKALDEADQRRLVEEALGELDFSTISAGERRN
jgi:F-type H+-transporting ATPase subunit b